MRRLASIRGHGEPPSLQGAGLVRDGQLRRSIEARSLRRWAHGPRPAIGRASAERCSHPGDAYDLCCLQAPHEVCAAPEGLGDTSECAAAQQFAHQQWAAGIACSLGSLGFVAGVDLAEGLQRGLDVLAPTRKTHGSGRGVKKMAVQRWVYEDRAGAGEALARKLSHYADRSDVVVLGLPRGGVPVAYEVARAIRAPLDVFVVRKLGVPRREELAMGAIASGGVRVINWDIVTSLGIAPPAIDRVAEEERQELERREEAYRGDREPFELRDRTVILVDDGLATGASMRAAVSAVRQQAPAKVVVAVPVSPPETCEALAEEADEVVCASTPTPFFGVGAWYRDFHQVSDREVRRFVEQTDETES